MQPSGLATLTILCRLACVGAAVPGYFPSTRFTHAPAGPFCNRSSWYIDHPCKLDHSDHCCDFRCTDCGPPEYCTQHSPFRKDHGTCNPRPDYRGPRLCPNYYQFCGEMKHDGWAPPSLGAIVSSSGDEMHPRCAIASYGFNRRAWLEDCARFLCRASGWSESHLVDAHTYKVDNQDGDMQFYHVVASAFQAEGGGHPARTAINVGARITANCTGQIRETLARTDMVMLREDHVEAKPEDHVTWSSKDVVAAWTFRGVWMLPRQCCRVLVHTFGKMQVSCGNGALWVPARLLTPCHPSMSRPVESFPTARVRGEQFDSDDSIFQNLGQYVEGHPEVMAKAQNAADLAWHSVEGWLLAPPAPAPVPLPVPVPDTAVPVNVEMEQGWSTTATVIVVIFTAMLAASCAAGAVAALSYRFLQRSARIPNLNASLLSAEAQTDQAHEMEAVASSLQDAATSPGCPAAEAEEGQAAPFASLPA